MLIFCLTPSGRIGARSFVMALVMLIAAGFAAALISNYGSIIGLCLIWPGHCAAARRLHDIGRSAIFALALAVANAAVWLAALVLSTPTIGNREWTLLPALLGIWGLLTLALMLGTLGVLAWLATARAEGDNRFGPAQSRHRPALRLVDPTV